MIDTGTTTLICAEALARAIDMVTTMSENARKVMGEKARQRAASLGLSVRVTTWCGPLAEFRPGSFDCGLCLHGCGALTVSGACRFSGRLHSLGRTVSEAHFSS